MILIDNLHCVQLIGKEWKMKLYSYNLNRIFRRHYQVMYSFHIY